MASLHRYGRNHKGKQAAVPLHLQLALIPLRELRKSVQLARPDAPF